LGVALYPDHGQSPDMLIRKADMAMYMAKQRGKNRFHLAPEEGEFLPEEEKRDAYQTEDDR
ncbi:MAG: diguanylate cyclase, partial [Desulfobulbaceae bacterium]|nr:diguanylate cyclase [Desulfobulbaceae bacterium]